MEISSVIYKDLSFKIVGICFDIYNHLGFGYREKYYQEAFAKELNNANIAYEREKRVNIEYKENKLGYAIIDFFVENEVIVEFKVRDYIGYVPYQQVKTYLKALKKELAIIIYITKEGVKYKRILNKLEYYN